MPDEKPWVVPNWAKKAVLAIIGTAGMGALYLLWNMVQFMQTAPTQMQEIKLSLDTQTQDIKASLENLAEIEQVKRNDAVDRAQWERLHETEKKLAEMTAHLAATNQLNQLLVERVLNPASKIGLVDAAAIPAPAPDVSLHEAPSAEVESYISEQMVAPNHLLFEPDTLEAVSSTAP